MSRSTLSRIQPLLRPATRSVCRSNRLAAFLPISQIQSSRRLYATENKDSAKQDFKGQLWESSSVRVQREREEQERFATKRNVGGSGGGAIGATIAIVAVAGIGYYLGTISVPKQSASSTLPLPATQAPEHDVSTGTLQAAWTDLKNIVGAEHISTEQSDLNSHASSQWSSHQNPESDVPFAVVKPSSTEEVSEIMKVCHTRKIPVVGYSGGTSLEGHFSSTRRGICIDFSRMDKILALHADDLDVIVQPAVGWEVLNESLAKDGLFFPPDPGPGAQIGGMIGTGCSGTNAYRYGTMKDWVLSLTVVMADGTIVKTRQRPRKSSAGYDLTRTFIGSEGTLGLVTEATLKLTSAPQNPRVAVCSFGSVREAANCVTKVVRSGVPIAAVELLDDIQMKCINDAGYTEKTWNEAPTLFFKFSGTSPGAVKESIDNVQRIAKQTGSKTFEFARDAGEADDLWSARKEALWSVMAKKEKDSDHVWTTDVAVPMTSLPDIVDETKKDMANCGLLGAIVGHVGDGNFHAIILYNDEERSIVEGVVHRMVKRAVELEGTTTGEHGVGLVKRDYLEHELGKGTVDAMRALKKAWDPLCLLNCDKIVRSQMPKKGEVKEW